MDAIGVLMDEIVRKHGNSYEKAERDPTYDWPASTTPSPAYAGGGSQPRISPSRNPWTSRRKRKLAWKPSVAQWGVRVIERMLREGNIDDAEEFARITVEAMQQEEEYPRSRS